MPTVSLPPPSMRDMVLSDPHRMELSSPTEKDAELTKATNVMSVYCGSQEGTNLMEGGGCWYQREEKKER